MLHTYESGNHNAPAILFLHAGGLSGKSWLPVMERLPEFHCLAPDLPEQGLSRAIPYSISRCVSEVAAIIREKVPTQKVHVIALSLGGPVALTLAGAYPQLVDHVLISGGSGQIPRWMVRLAKSTLWMYRLFSPESLIQATLRQQGIPAEYESLVRDDLLQSLDPAFMRNYMDELSTWQLPDCINQPLLLAVGERESRAAFRFARNYLRHYPHAQGLVVPGVRHAWSLQNPDLFANLVRTWVTDSPLPPRFKPLS
jgi:pimeloyl-ACP methyl ester carboxylesterase